MPAIRLLLILDPWIEEAIAEVVPEEVEMMFERFLIRGEGGSPVLSIALFVAEGPVMCETWSTSGNIAMLTKDEIVKVIKMLWSSMEVQVAEARQKNAVPVGHAGHPHPH